MRFRGLPRREVLGRHVPIATGFLSRLLGLALLCPDRAGVGLLIPRCHSVHTFGMRFRLDLVFLDGEGRIVDFCGGVPPRRFVRSPTAAAVLEVPSRGRSLVP